MKKLISLISTEGKSKKQIVKETWAAFQKYSKVEAEQIEINNKKESLKATKKSTEL